MVDEVVARSYLTGSTLVPHPSCSSPFMMLEGSSAITKTGNVGKFLFQNETNVLRGFWGSSQQCDSGVVKVAGSTMSAKKE